MILLQFLEKLGNNINDTTAHTNHLPFFKKIKKEILLSVENCLTFLDYFIKSYSSNDSGISHFLYEIANQSGDERVVVKSFAQLVQELRKCTTKPVVFLIDQCNAFHANPQTIKLYSDSEKKMVSADENPVGAMFLDWNTFKVNRGGIFWIFFCDSVNANCTRWFCGTFF